MRGDQISAISLGVNTFARQFFANFATRYRLFLEALANGDCLELGIWKLMIRFLPCSNAAMGARQIRFAQLISS